MNATILALVDGEHDACLQELAVRRLAPLAARSASVHALLTRCDVALAAHLRPLDVRCRAIAAVAPDWTTVRDLATLAREVNAGVLYAHGTVAHLICAMAAPLVGIPVVAHLWHAITIGDVHASSLCGSTVVTSTEFGRSQALAVGCKDVAVIPTPARKGPEVCPRSTGPYTFGWAGAWRGHDAGDLFLAAASMVVAARADVRFLVSKPPRNRPAIDGSLAQRAIGQHGIIAASAITDAARRRRHQKQDIHAGRLEGFGEPRQIGPYAVDPHGICVDKEKRSVAK